MKFEHRIGLMLMAALIWLGVPESGLADGSGMPPARVVTALVTETAIAEQADVVGTLFFDRVADLSAEVGGLVNQVLVKEGDQVKKGALMFRMNTDFIDNEITLVLANMEQVKVRLAKAQKDLIRFETLFRKEAVSERDYDDVFYSKKDLVEQIHILETKLALARLKKQKSDIRAPFDGVVLEKKSEKGNWISPGTGMCSVGSIKDFFVKVPVSENILVFARRDMAVPVRIEALGKKLMGTIASVIPVADPQTKSVFVKVRLPLIENPVLNMSAIVSMPVGEKKNRILIPRDALVNMNGRDMVYTVKAGKAEIMPVGIIAYVGENIAVKPDGIKPGMPLVVDGNDRLRPGQAVTIIN